MAKLKTCSISGNKYKADESNFYVNNNSDDGLHPYHKFYDNKRRYYNISVDKMREIINFKNN